VVLEELADCSSYTKNYHYSGEVKRDSSFSSWSQVPSCP
jgi:hypothetical protein